MCACMPVYFQSRKSCDFCEGSPRTEKRVFFKVEIFFSMRCIRLTVIAMGVDHCIDSEHKYVVILFFVPFRWGKVQQ